MKLHPVGLKVSSNVGVSGLQLNSLTFVDPWLTAFSITKNIKDVVSSNVNSNEIRSVHGIRFVNVLLVYLSHKSMIMTYSPYANKSYLEERSRGPLSMPFQASYIYTDLFFMLSGLLLSHSIIGKLQKGMKINYAKEIAGRYMRVIPPMAAVVIFSTYILPHLASGPQWNIITDEADTCKSTWWMNILMIQNWFGVEKICLYQTHHVATDFVLCTISLFLIVFVHHHPRKGVAMLTGLGVASMMCRYYVSYSRQLNIYVTVGVG